MGRTRIALFDSFERTDLAKGSRLEPDYEWWNRSARQDVHDVRVELERWLSRYPARHRRDLARRFRSRHNHLHQGALFELFVHEQLVKAGLSVRCHPRVSARNGRRPDFVAQTRRGVRFFVEATCAGPSEDALIAERRKNEVIEAFDSLTDERWSVSVRVSGRAGLGPPARPRDLKRRLRLWLDSLVPGSLVLEPFIWEAHGLRFSISASPQLRRSDGTSYRRLLRSESPGHASFVPPGHAGIEAAFGSKAGRYGKPRVPYIVAINVLDNFADSSRVMEALKACWGTRRRPRNTRVSGVLLATIWNPIAATNRALSAVRNPGAALPLPRLPFKKLGIWQW